MWKCDNCLEKAIKDKYKNCWNCGTPKPTEQEIKSNQQVVRDVPKINEPKIIRKEPEIVEKILPKIETEPPVETPSPVEAEIPAEINVVKPEIPAATKSVVENDFLSAFDSQTVEKPSSKLALAIPVLLWLIALIATGIFAYLSNQKTVAFDNQILEDGKSFNQQKDKFVFPEANLPTRKNQSIVEGNIKGKVLPVNRKNNEVAPLYYNLPDDLRPINLGEAKTLLWLDCRTEQVERYKDGTVGLQEKCNSYLVERETSKIIGIQDFLGVSPSFVQQKEAGDKIGYVSTDRYLTYLREKQPEAERSLLKFPSDSPNHHFFNKSEFVFAIVLLCALVAIGLGWLAYQIKFARNTN